RPNCVFEQNDVRRASDRLPSLRKRRVTPHTLRHSCGAALLQAGVDVSVIRDYLGHVSVATTSRYIATNLQMKRQVLEAFWRRAGLLRTRPATGVRRRSFWLSWKLSDSYLDRQSTKRRATVLQCSCLPSNSG